MWWSLALVLIGGALASQECAVPSEAGVCLAAKPKGDFYNYVDAHVPKVREEDVATVHRMVDTSAKGVKKADSGIWLFEELLRPEVVNRVLEKLPVRDSPEWTGCPAIEHNKKKRCFMLPIGEDSLLREIVDRFKAAWGEHLDTSALTHLAINRVMPGKAEDELHADVFTGRPGEPRQNLERPSAHNIIYLTGQPSTSNHRDQRPPIVLDKSNLNDTVPLSVPLSSWPVTKQWKERPADDAKCGINIVYLTEQPVHVPSNESGQLHFPQAHVTVTPKAGSMVSFAMTEDNDHFVGKFSDQAPVDRISIQLPVSVFGSSKAIAYMEYVGNGSPSPPPPRPPPPPAYDCTFERGNIEGCKHPSHCLKDTTHNNNSKADCCGLAHFLHNAPRLGGEFFWWPLPTSQGGCGFTGSKPTFTLDPNGTAYRPVCPGLNRTALAPVVV